MDAHIGEVVQPERTVPGHGGSGLGLARGPGAGVVQAQGESQRKFLRVPHPQIAVAGPGVDRRRWHDLHVGIDGRQALEVLQPLLDVAQVEQIARRRRDGVEQMPRFRVAAVVTDRGNAAGHQRQNQCARAQILRSCEDAGRDVATLQDGLLHTRHDDVDALRAEATADGRIAAVVSRGVRQTPAEPFDRLALQHNAIDREARRFRTGQLRGSNRGELGTAQIHAPLLPLPQQPLPLLLALFLDERPRHRGGLSIAGVDRPKNTTQHQGQIDETP